MAAQENMSNPDLRIAFIGFGEAAQAFCGSLGSDAVSAIRAFDIKSLGPEQAAMDERYRAQGVSGCDSLAAALDGANLVFSVVTADAAGAVARDAAAHLAEGALFLDCNSCAPQTKQASESLAAAAGAHYVDVAVMAPVNPLRHRTPLLLSGEHADAASRVLSRLGMNPEVESGPVGRSSSVKMVRSIMVKGMEALFAECFLAGRLAGVEARVLASLEASDPDVDWAGRRAYNLERMTRHGTRRGAEMDEVSRFLHHLGIDQPLAARTAEWQKRIGASGVSLSGTDDQASLDQLINTLNLDPLKEA